LPKELQRLRRKPSKWTVHGKEYYTTETRRSRRITPSALASG
jgi:hypothetical protein